MKIFALSFIPHEFLITNSLKRSVLYIQLDCGNVKGWGEIAPHPHFSRESVEEAFNQLNTYKQDILSIDWSLETYAEYLEHMNLFPSVYFGLESALLSLLNPLKEHTVPVSAFFMGEVAQILEQAPIKIREGYKTAKLKVGHLSFADAAYVIEHLKNHFHLRVDVNRAWSTADSFRFFEQYPIDTFDYVEEPFSNPSDLSLFPHPLAIDESFLNDINLEELEMLPKLKALIYKPTIQGGLLSCKKLLEWTNKRRIQLILGSSFESDLGLTMIASMSYRLGLTYPIGIGTYDYLTTRICYPSLAFSNACVRVPEQQCINLTLKTRKYS